MSDRTIPAGWYSLKLPYSIRYSPPIYGRGRADETWSLDAVDAGYGLRCYPTAERAEAEAERLFGPPPIVIFTIKLLPNRTQVRVEAAEGVKPEGALLAAIDALEAERAALASCPMHTLALSTPTTPDEDVRAGSRNFALLQGDNARMAQALRAVADAMLRGGDGAVGDFGWNITALNKARPLIRQALEEKSAFRPSEGEGGEGI